MDPKTLSERLHPRLAKWFTGTFEGFTHAQLLCIPPVLEEQSILLTSPTGSGKTLAAFIGIFDYLLRTLGRENCEDPKQRMRPTSQRDLPTPTPVQCIYISPLRALAYDVEKNLRAPILGMGLEKEFSVHLRTGDTTPAARAKFRRYGARFVVTTPESLSVMLAQQAYAGHFRSCRFVIIDELHSFAGNKRGADLTISLERLDRLCRGRELALRRPRTARRAVPPFCRIGLSATAAPIDVLAHFLVGGDRTCLVAEAETEKKSIVEVFSPIRRDPYPPAGYTGARLYAELADLIRRHQSVLVFTNVRSAAEQIGLRLRELLSELSDQIETHHASLDRSVRLEVEDRLKNGELRAVVCSTSLELGIDIGAVDLVVMVATPKGVSRAIQRIGRSGHSLDRSSHGILVATNVSDLVEATVTAKLVRERALDPIRVQEKPFDVVAQHIVGMAASDAFTADEMFILIRRAYPFRDLTREEFERIIAYLEGGGESLAGQYSGLFGKIRIENGTVRLAHPRIGREFLVNIGTIVSEGFVDVVLKTRRLGSVEENFIKQLQIGDLFILAGRVVRLINTGVNEAFVERADGHLPTVPRWNAAKMPLTSGLARAVRNFRTDLCHRVEHGTDEEAVEWLVENYDLSTANAQAIVKQFRAQLSVSEIPAGHTMLIELYRETNHSHHFFHTLIGRSANDALSRIVAWRVKKRIGGNALVTIDDYGFLLTLRPFQEMPLEDWRLCFEREGAEEDLQRALHGSELVKWQFRGVAQTGLMVPRNLPGRQRQRKQLSWSAEVLFRVLQQHEPTHPLLNESYRQAMHIFLDSDAACRFLDGISGFEWTLRELPAVSPFSFPIYASVIKESMMLEDPAAAIERIYHEMYARLESTTSLRPRPGGSIGCRLLSSTVTFKDHFSEQAADYAKFRPNYPAELFAYFRSLQIAHDCAWDCATGSGQAAIGLAGFFDRVVATDASQKQIARAAKNPRVEYQVAAAEKSGLATHSIDLITVAQALHWFNLDAFFEEVRRVLKPQGVLAVWCYGLLDIAPQIDVIINHFYNEIVGQYWPPERHIVESRYQSIQFPFAEVQPPQFQMETRWSLTELIGYLRTWSATRAFMAATGKDPTELIISDLGSAWAEPQRQRLVNWPLTLRVGVAP